MSRVVTLRDCADFLSGGTPSKDQPNYWGGTIPWVSAKDMKAFYLDDSEDHVTATGVSNGTRLAPRGATLILVRGMTLLKDVPIGSVRQPLTFNQDVKALVPREGVDPGFLTYAVLAKKVELLGAVELAGHGTGRLPTDRLFALEIWLPLPREQRAIAAVLGALDDKIDLNHRMNETLEETARALFKSWFVDFDPVRAKAEGRQPFGMDAATAALFPDGFEESEMGEVPKGWRAGCLGDVALFHNSKRIPLSAREREVRKGPFPYYGAAGLVDRVDGFLFDGEYVLVGEDGSVVDGDGGPITQHVWGRFWVNNHAHVISAKENGSLAWLLNAVSSLDVRPYVTGAVQPKLSQGRIRECRLVVPPVALDSAFGRIASPVYARMRASAEETTSLAELRDYLLPKLLSGEVRVRDAEKLVGEAT